MGLLLFITTYFLYIMLQKASFNHLHFFVHGQIYRDAQNSKKPENFGGPVSAVYTDRGAVDAEGEPAGGGFGEFTPQKILKIGSIFSHLRPFPTLIHLRQNTWKIA